MSGSPQYPRFPTARQRRSARLAAQLPIRVFGIDYRGKDFVEDSSTLVVNLHGAKIRLLRQVMPEQEVRILCLRNNQDDVFRVVLKVEQEASRFSFWGVECLRTGRNIWDIDFPPLAPGDQTSVRIMLQCPECRTRELLYVDEPLLEASQELGGLVRGCVTCGYSGLWSQVPYNEA